VKLRQIVPLVTIIMFLTVSIVISAPPLPHNVEGRVLYPGGAGVENGILVRILDFNNSQEIGTEVDAPPAPPLAGSYSAVVNGTTGDLIIVRSWNATHYGESNATLLETTTTIDVTLNITRPSEANVTILSPNNDTEFNISVTFNITANVTILGGQDGTGCEAQIKFGNVSVINVTSSNTTSLGSIGLGSTVTVSFEVRGFALGFSNATINVSCDSDGVNFERLNSDTVFNLTILDEARPIINLIAPVNNSVNKTNNNMTFRYNVTDGSLVPNCSLIINSNNNLTDESVQRVVEQNFSLVLPNGVYNWSVNCTDAVGNTGSSATYNLTIEVFSPNITFINVTQSIILAAGSTFDVECNFTVEDLNNISDISNVNATFFFFQNSSTDPDDNNVHYSNSSCTETGSSTNTINYTCGFSILYYAVNGTWNCNATAIDQQSFTDSRIINTTIDPLFALNTSTNLIDYLNSTIGSTSVEVIVNITNLGNQPINITVRGYGGNDPVAGNGSAMICPTNNISIENERFSVFSGAFNSKTTLNYTSKHMNFTIPKQTSASQKINSSYWQIFIPVTTPTLGNGICNGTVIFQAEVSN